MDRRNFLRGLFAAPAIVAYDRIMPVKLIDWRLEGWVPIENSIADLQYLDPPNYLTHLLESMRLSKEYIAAELFNEMEP